MILSVKTRERTELVDITSEIEKIKADLEYSEGFLKSVMKKLNNENFIKNAPPKVVDIEKSKKADAEAKIRVLEEKLKDLKGS